MKIDNCSVDQTGFLRTVELTESFCPRPARRQRTASIWPSWPARFYWPQRRQRKSRIARCAHVWVKIVCMSRCDVGTSLICHDDDRNLLSCLYVFTHHGFVVGGVKEYWFNYHRQYLCLGCVLHQMHLGGKPVRDLVVKHGHCVTSSQWSSLPANKQSKQTLQYNPSKITSLGTSLYSLFFINDVFPLQVQMAELETQATRVLQGYQAGVLQVLLTVSW